MPQDIAEVTLPQSYRLGFQMGFKQDQTRLFNVVFNSPNERDLILYNRHNLKGFGNFGRRDYLLAERINRREAEKEPKPRLDNDESDLKIVNFRVVSLQHSIIPKPLKWSSDLPHECPELAQLGVQINLPSWMKSPSQECASRIL
ncbi:unnamed protein product [Schistosoma margrebowiei]|uniref:Uncharacterized protein n=1 Tax=Schistosoma margrebowiei TaxID=48269 RepID=A0A183MPU4_9TREM|nr:unnamed protein product [Schistosoma margrebowiei]